MKIDLMNKGKIALVTSSAGEANRQLPEQKSRELAHNDEAICPITYEPINLFPHDDIYVTMSGVKYHKPTLKQWLQNSDMMPHNNTEDQKELLRLWPNSYKKSAALNRNYYIFENLSSALLFGVTLGALGLQIYSFGFLGKDVMIPKISLGIMVGLPIPCLYCGRKADEIRRELTSKELLAKKTRPMTDEEIDKATLGLDFYASKTA